VQVPSIPGAGLPGTSQESSPVGTFPCDSVSTEAEEQVVRFRKSSLVRDFVRRPEVDSEQSQHPAFVRHTVQLVEFWPAPEGRIGQIKRIGRKPAFDILLCPLRHWQGNPDVHNSCECGHAGDRLSGCCTSTSCGKDCRTSRCYRRMGPCVPGAPSGCRLVK